jgi:hypothetical protein
MIAKASIQAASAAPSMLAPYSMRLMLATQAAVLLFTTSAIMRAESKAITSDKSTVDSIRLALAVSSSTWVIEFKSKVHVIPIVNGR